MKRPGRVSLYQQVANNLNKKGIKPFSAREWKATNVQSVAYGHIINEQAMAEINKVFRKHNLELKCKSS